MTEDPAGLLKEGVARHRRGRLAEAAALYSQVLALEPRRAEVHSNLGAALAGLGDFDGALAAFRAALALRPEYPQAEFNLGCLLRDCGRVSESEAAFRAAVTLKPDYAEAWSNLGGTLITQGRTEEAEAAVRRALALQPDSARIGSNLLFMMNHDAAVSAAAIDAESRRWGAAREAAVPAPAAHDNDPDPERRLKLGYVSPDFRAHAVARFLMPLFEAHDRAAFKLVCYAGVAKPDAVTEWFRRRADHWRSTLALSDADMAARIRSDRIDILIDLAGHSAGNRLPVFARRPAPVQVTWLGYPNTTGLTAIGYRLTDAIADPPGGGDDHHSERLVRLPAGFLCYRPPADCPAVAPPPAASKGCVTFGCFNKFAKVTPLVIASWVDILGAVPDSRLMLKSAAMGDRAVAERTRHRFAAAGIDPARLDLRGHTPSAVDHLALYGEVDVALDTFPYNGTTTSCEALWMGVPLVTLAGDRHAARVGASILTRIGLPELIATAPSPYVATAVTLARDPARLAALRADLRERVAASPLCDGSKFARDLEAALRQLWRAWCEGHAASGAAS